MIGDSQAISSPLRLFHCIVLLMPHRRPCSPLLLVALGVLLFGGGTSKAQVPRVTVGGGWAVPTDNVEARSVRDGDERTLGVDLKPGPHVYVGAGFTRSIGDNFLLGARLRGQASRLRSDVDECEAGRCPNPDGLLRAATVEGRIILTLPDWIHPYLLVGLGVVHARADGVTVQATETAPVVEYEEVSVTDAGGDVGLGATVPVVAGLRLDAEFRVTGALPGGKENSVTVLPFSLGVAYAFE
jgi:opacity protein-like surface antigen